MFVAFAVGEVQVYFGEALVTNITSMSGKFIKGFIPPNPTAPNALVDIVIKDSKSIYTMEKAFRYLNDYSPKLNVGPVW